MGEDLGGGALFEHAVQRGDVVPGKAFALILAPDDVPEGFQFLDGRDLIIGPLGFRARLGLKLPTAAEPFGTHLAFFTLGGGGFPDVDVSHADRFFGVVRRMPWFRIDES